MICDTCEQEPCTCQPTQSIYYYFKECATPQCCGIVGARIGQPIDPPICKWCQAGTAYYSGKPGAMQKKG